MGNFILSFNASLPVKEATLPDLLVIEYVVNIMVTVTHSSIVAGLVVGHGSFVT